MSAADGRLTAKARGEINKDDKGVLVIERIHVTYRLEVDADARAEQEPIIERVHGMHASRCPVARSLMPAIEITTAYELVERKE